jgi:molybdate/tungstate transport system substrate-binding protein
MSALLAQRNSHSYCLIMLNTGSAGRALRAWPLAALVTAGLVLTACGSSTSTSSSGAKAKGTADVAYAASLGFLNEKVFGPAFHSAKGFGYSGQAGESGALEAEIAAKAITPNVFQAVGADNITPLFPKFSKWLVQYAGTQMTVAYNPASKYGSDFAAIASGSKPICDLFPIMEKKGFLLGRTDPNTDPQGRSFIYMIELATTYCHLPASTVTKILGSPLASSSSSQVFAETSLLAHLQAGQLDASSAYLSQAIQLHLHYIKLPPAINLGDPAMKAQYHNASITITGNVTKHGSPLAYVVTIIGKPTSASTAFVAFVLSPAGRALYQREGYDLLTPTVTGDAGAVPAAVKAAMGG